MEPEYGQIFAENCVVEENILYLFPYTGNGIVKINMDNNQATLLNTQLPVGCIWDNMEAETIYSEAMCSLEDFLRYSQMQDTTRLNRDTELAGKKIWDYITDNL